MTRVRARVITCTQGRVVQVDGRGRLGRFSNNGSVVQRQGAHTVVWKFRVRLLADSFSFVSRQRVGGGRPSDAGASFLLAAAS